MMMNAFVARRAGVSPALTSRLPARPVAVLRSVAAKVVYMQMMLQRLLVWMAFTL